MAGGVNNPTALAHGCRWDPERQELWAPWVCHDWGELASVLVPCLLWVYSVLCGCLHQRAAGEREMGCLVNGPVKGLAVLAKLPVEKCWDIPTENSHHYCQLITITPMLRSITLTGKKNNQPALLQHLLQTCQACRDLLMSRTCKGGEHEDGQVLRKRLLDPSAVYHERHKALTCTSGSLSSSTWFLLPSLQVTLYNNWRGNSEVLLTVQDTRGRQRWWSLLQIWCWNPGLVSQSTMSSPTIYYLVE